jgi:hypothetical protein
MRILKLMHEHEARAVRDTLRTLENMEELLMAEMALIKSRLDEIRNLKNIVSAEGQEDRASD